MSKLMFAIPSFPGKEKVMAKAAMVGAKVAQKSPELCIGGAIVCGVGATVMACRATLKVGEVIDYHNDYMNKINTMRQKIDNHEEGTEKLDYTPEDSQRDKFILFVQTAVKVGKLYAPAILLGAASIGLMLGGHHILMKRNAALALAATTIKQALDEYRGRVREEVGEELENDIFKGVRRTTIEEKNDKGKIVKKEVFEQTTPCSPYTRIFDEVSTNWSKDAEANKFFLYTVQDRCNDRLRWNGHLFLNEVFDMLDLPRTKMGAVCGWIYGEGDSFVDFGLSDLTKEGVRRFINAAENHIWLDFNCDGVIYDKI